MRIVTFCLAARKFDSPLVGGVNIIFEALIVTFPTVFAACSQTFTLCQSVLMVVCVMNHVSSCVGQYRKRPDLSRKC